MFPDDRARYRQWQIGCALGLVLALDGEALLQRGDGPAWAQVSGIRRDRTARADHLDRPGAGHPVRSSPPSQANILLSSLGRTDPVYAAARVRHGQVRRQWWQATVDLEFGNGRHVNYRVRGVRAPGALASVFDSQQLPS